MKYIVIDARKIGTGDTFITEHETAADAIQEAQKQWDHLTTPERRKRKIYVLESVNPEEDAHDHYDGNLIYTAGETALYTASSDGGFFIDQIETIEEGKRLIAAYEDADRKKHIYTPGFYDIVNDGHRTVLN